MVKRKGKGGWFGQPRKHAEAAKKGWRKRRSKKKGNNMLDLIQVGKGVVEITLDDKTVINFENPYPIGAKPPNKYELWIFWPYKRTPIPDYFLSKHKRFYKSFNGIEPDAMYMTEIDDTNVFKIGTVKSEVYISDKEGKLNQQYIHHHNTPHPSLYTNDENSLFIIKGGNFKIVKKSNYPLAWFFD